MNWDKIFLCIVIGGFISLFAAAIIGFFWTSRLLSFGLLFYGAWWVGGKIEKWQLRRREADDKS